MKTGGALALTLASVLFLSGVWCIYLSPVSTAREQTKQFMQDSVTLGLKYDIMTYTVTVETTDRLTITLHRTDWDTSRLNTTNIPLRYSGYIVLPPYLPQVSLYLYDPLDHIIWSEEQRTHVHSTIQLTSGEYKILIFYQNDLHIPIRCFITLKVMGDVKYQPLQPVGSLLILMSLPIFGLGIRNLVEHRSEGDK